MPGSGRLSPPSLDEMGHKSPPGRPVRCPNGRQPHKRHSKRDTSASVKEAIQGGASSGVVEPVRGILSCYTHIHVYLLARIYDFEVTQDSRLE